MATGTQSSEGLVARGLFQRDDQVSMTPDSRAEHEFEYFDTDNVASQEDIPPDKDMAGCALCVCFSLMRIHGVSTV